MDLSEREILEDETDLRVVGGDFAEEIVELAAGGTLEVGELDDGDGGVGGAFGGIAGRADLGAGGGEGVGGHVVEIAAEEEAGVAGDVNGERVGLIAEGDLDVHLIEAGDRSGLERADGEFEGRAPGVEFAEMGFDFFADGGGVGGGGRLGGGLGGRSLGGEGGGGEEDCEEQVEDHGVVPFPSKKFHIADFKRGESSEAGRE